MAQKQNCCIELYSVKEELQKTQDDVTNFYRALAHHLNLYHNPRRSLTSQ